MKIRTDFITTEERLLERREKLINIIKFESVLWALSLTAFASYLIYQINTIGA